MKSSYFIGLRELIGSLFHFQLICKMHTFSNFDTTIFKNCFNIAKQNQGQKTFKAFLLSQAIVLNLYLLGDFGYKKKYQRSSKNPHSLSLYQNIILLR